MKGTQIVAATLLIGIFLYFDNYLVGNIVGEIGEFLFSVTISERLEGQVATWKLFASACIVYSFLSTVVVGFIAAITKTPRSYHSTLFEIALVLKVLQHLVSYFFISGATFFNIHIAYAIIIALLYQGTKKEDSEQGEGS